MQLIKLVNYKRPYIGKTDGKRHPSITYVLKEDIATASNPAATLSVAVYPKFDKSKRDWFNLDTMAKTETIGTKEDMDKADISTSNG